MRILSLFFVILLAGCSSIKVEDVAGASASAATTAVISTVNPVAGIATGIVAGVATEAAIDDGRPDVEISEVTNVHQEEVAKAQVKADLLESLGREVIIGAGAVFLLWTWLTWFIGARRARPEELTATAQRDLYQRMVENKIDKA